MGLTLLSRAVVAVLARAIRGLPVPVAQDALSTGVMPLVAMPAVAAVAAPAIAKAQGVRKQQTVPSQRAQQILV